MLPANEPIVQKVICFTLSAANVIARLIMLFANIEKTTPIKIIVFVESEKSSLYDRESISISEAKANISAITIVPASGMLGIDIPKAIASTAPKLAPEDTPKVEPSASGFLSSPCIAAPHIEREMPTNATDSTRGSLTDTITEYAMPSGTGFANIALYIARNTSLMGMFTLPKHTHNISVHSVSIAKII